MSLEAVTIMCVISAVAGQPSMRDNPLANTKQANLCQPFFGAIAPSLPTVLLVRFYWLRKAAARPVFNIILPLVVARKGAHGSHALALTPSARVSARSGTANRC